MRRLFFALWPNDKIRKRIDVINKTIKSDGLKNVKSTNMHVTLVYLGNVNAESEVILRRRVENINVQPFVLYFDQLVFWQKPRVLCLSTKENDQQLMLLVDTLKSIVEQCGIKTEKRPYKPHITLVRKAHKLINIDVKRIEWQAESFCLVESCSTSSGVQYQVLQRWNLNLLDSGDAFF